jgi:hypothetical protein
LCESKYDFWPETVKSKRSGKVKKDYYLQVRVILMVKGFHQIMATSVLIVYVESTLFYTDIQIFFFSFTFLVKNSNCPARSSHFCCWRYGGWGGGGGERTTVAGT